MVLLHQEEHANTPVRSRSCNKVLVAEDNPVFQRMLGGMLAQWGYEISLARDGGEAWERLCAADGPRLAILDWMMPVMDGVEICRRIRALRQEPYVYILLLTAKTESDDLVEGMEAGADDYLTKPFRAHELRVRLRAGRRILELQEDLVMAREALRQQATRDGLTGLWNRTAILETLEKELARAGREGQPLSVLMVDLDRFKHINDTHGHLAGDHVLREAAQRMSAALRSYDALGRFGGEEFLIILPHCSGPAAIAQAERIRRALASEPFLIGDLALPVTCSVGLSWTINPEVSQMGELIRSADAALYLAKNRGRDRAEVARFQDALVG